VPRTRSLRTLAEAVQGCLGCDLAGPAVQAVFGRGPGTASIMLVGEQPGDREDVEGLAFVGPAGKVLDRAVADAGLDFEDLYITNAVKHFRFRERGKRRLHQKPTAGQTTACQPWLAAEMRVVRPTTVVALGSTAATSLFGSGFTLTEHRGTVLGWPPAEGAFASDTGSVRSAVATYHPSAALRAPDRRGRDEIYAALVADLQLAAAKQ